MAKLNKMSLDSALIMSIPAPFSSVRNSGHGSPLDEKLKKAGLPMMWVPMIWVPIGWVPIIWGCLLPNLVAALLNIILALTLSVLQ